MFFTSQIKSKQPAVTTVVSQVEECLQASGLCPDQTAEVCLVLAEALNNVVEHAYQYSEDGDIDISVSLQGIDLKITINDFGPAFSAPEPKGITPPASSSLDNLPEGGFGWPLIQMLTDNISLNRINERNHLELEKTVICPSR